MPLMGTMEPTRTPIDPNTASLQDLYLYSLTSKWMILSFIGILVLAGIALYTYRKE
ncbi:MAG: hypothetical protein LUQ37_06940 [Methanoregulaceae archaeon]|nr:hypothetical protein [Methanoregulaceae archaeon]